MYYWPNVEQCFKNVYSVLKRGGSFLICNEDCSLEGNEEIADALDMKFYGAEDLEKYLRHAGFNTVNIYKKGKWISAVGIK